MQQYTQSRQNKVKIISLLVFIVLLVGLFFWYRISTGTGNTAQAASEQAMFMGLRQASAQEIHTLWPDAKGRPLLVEFYSQYCLDCKKMAPVVKDITARHPQVRFRSFEIMADRKGNAAVFEAFKPATVPVLVFIKPNGRIHNVLYNYQTANTLTANLKQITPLQKAAAPKAN